MDYAQTLLAHLPQAAAVILVLAFILICLQEATNGFHDMANAIAMTEAEPW